jgi:hypothetical protein
MRRRNTIRANGKCPDMTNASLTASARGYSFRAVFKAIATGARTESELQWKE